MKCRPLSPVASTCLRSLFAMLLMLGCEGQDTLPFLARQEPANEGCREPASGSALPVQLKDFCLAAFVPVRRYGARAQPLDEYCSQHLGAPCGELSSLGLESAEVAVYVARHSSASVEVSMLAFPSAELSYAYVASEVLSGDDPARTVALPLDRAPGGLRHGRLSRAHERLALELRYFDPTEMPASAQARSLRLLPELALLLASSLPGAGGAPREVRMLPTAHRLPLGTGYLATDVLGVPSTGSGAVGSYARGQKRWRQVFSEKEDPESVRDVLSTLKRFHRAAVIKDAPLEALRFSARIADAGPRVAWVVAERGRRLFAIGDEAFAFDPTLGEADNAQRRLTEAEKIQELRAWVQRAPSSLP